MKLTTKKSFTPIVIELETLEEAENVYQMLASLYGRSDNSQWKTYIKPIEEHIKGQINRHKEVSGES